MTSGTWGGSERHMEIQAARISELEQERDGLVEALEQATKRIDALEAENERYRMAIKTALDTMAVANDEQLGPGGVARKAYAHLWHEYFAIPAGINRRAIDSEVAA